MRVLFALVSCVLVAGCVAPSESPESESADTSGCLAGASVGGYYGNQAPANRPALPGGPPPWHGGSPQPPPSGQPGGDR
jgi:hypothetical protein